MPYRAKIHWIDAHRHLRRAQALVSRYDVDKVHPGELITPLPTQEQMDWDDLLNQIK